MTRSHGQAPASFARPKRLVATTDSAISHRILPSDLALSPNSPLFSPRNSFSGPLPSLANLTSLQKLYLDKTISPIPSGFFQGLTSLQILTLSQNLVLHLGPSPPS
ncbi:receptor-like kinase tmk4 [Quercus suber]|uniref:Receptor-like kinase tmk4 n=1 Tax=Quercus suber TaxID=58331 RepID=A0AAW0JLP6_QUESU